MAKDKDEVVLKFVGPRDPSGAAFERFEGVPTRDLTEADLRRVERRRPDFDLKVLTKKRPGGGDPLYEAVDKPAASSAARSTADDKDKPAGGAGTAPSEPRGQERK